jgi:hypothetical protein
MVRGFIFGTKPPPPTAGAADGAAFAFVKENLPPFPGAGPDGDATPSPVPLTPPNSRLVECDDVDSAGLNAGPRVTVRLGPLAPPAGPAAVRRRPPALRAAPPVPVMLISLRTLWVGEGGPPSRRPPTALVARAPSGSIAIRPLAGREGADTDERTEYAEIPDATDPASLVPSSRSLLSLTICACVSMRAISFIAAPHEWCGRSMYSFTSSIVTLASSKRDLTVIVVLALAAERTLATEPVGDGGRGLRVPGGGDEVGGFIGEGSGYPIKKTEAGRVNMPCGARGERTRCQSPRSSYSDSERKSVVPHDC